MVDLRNHNKRVNCDRATVLRSRAEPHSPPQKVVRPACQTRVGRPVSSARFGASKQAPQARPQTVHAPEDLVPVKPTTFGFVVRLFALFLAVFLTFQPVYVAYGVDLEEATEAPFEEQAPPEETSEPEPEPVEEEEPTIETEASSEPEVTEEESASEEPAAEEAAAEPTDEQSTTEENAGEEATEDGGEEQTENAGDEGESEASQEETTSENTKEENATEEEIVTIDADEISEGGTETNNQAAVGEVDLPESETADPETGTSTESSEGSEELGDSEENTGSSTPAVENTPVPSSSGSGGGSSSNDDDDDDETSFETASSSEEIYGENIGSSTASTTLDTTGTSTPETATSTSSTTSATESGNSNTSGSSDSSGGTDGADTDTDTQNASSTDEGEYIDSSITIQGKECVTIVSGEYYCFDPEKRTMPGEDTGPATVVARKDHQGDREIYLLDGERSIQITHNNYDDFAPTYDDGTRRIAWQALIDDRLQIMLHDRKTGETVQVTNETFNSSNPHVYGNQLVWQSWIGDNWEIFLADRINRDDPKILQLTDNNTHDMFPQIYDDFVSWQAQTKDSWHVVVYDKDSEHFSYVEKRGNGKYENPRFVLLFDNRKENGDVEVVGYDVATDEEIPLAPIQNSIPDPVTPTEDTGEAIPPTSTSSVSVKQGERKEGGDDSEAF